MSRQELATLYLPLVGLEPQKLVNNTAGMKPSSESENKDIQPQVKLI